MLFKWFSLYVRNVLMLYRRPTIEKFQLGIDDKIVEMFVDDVKMWLRFAFGREVKEVQLSTKYCDESILPMLNCQSLVTLDLSGCKIECQSQVHLGSLRKLSLHNVYLCDEALIGLISGCPSLQELVLEDPVGLEELCFIAPSIENLVLSFVDIHFFRILSCPNLKFLEFGIVDSIPSVIDVSSLCEFNFNRFYAIGKIADELITCDKVERFLKKFLDLEVFKLSYEASELVFAFLEDIDLPENIWKRVVLELNFYDEENLLGTFQLLRSSLQLEELIIYAPEDNDEFSTDLLPLDLCSPYVMPRLKTITIHGYNEPFEFHLQLVEFLLKSAVMLNQMLLVRGKHQLTAAELEFVKQLSSFQRASTNARIVFA